MRSKTNSAVWKQFVSRRLAANTTNINNTKTIIVKRSMNELQNGRNNSLLEHKNNIFLPTFYRNTSKNEAGATKPDSTQEESPPVHKASSYQSD